MNSINKILAFFKSLTLKEIIDVWIGIAIIVIFKILSSFLSYLIIKLFNIKTKNKKAIKDNSFYKPLKTFFIILGIYIALRILQLPDNMYFYIAKGFKIVTIILATIGLANIFNSNSDAYTKLLNKFHFNGNDTLVTFIGKIAKAFIYIISGFIIITELGYNLGGLATGLGISSVVIALAAQDLAKSILSGFSIISDKPFEIGDYIEVGTYSGTVEDITFRTTRIRDLSDQVVVIPNSLISSTSIINGSKRKQRRYNLRLILELDTPLNKVSHLVDTIKLTLETHPSIIQENLRVIFDTISDNGIDLDISFFTPITDFEEFSKLKSEINYTILDIIKKSHVELAYPSQSLYLKKE